MGHPYLQWMLAEGESRPLRYPTTLHFSPRLHGVVVGAAVPLGHRTLAASDIILEETALAVDLHQN